MEKFEGDWVRIIKVMENPKNRKMWNFGLQEVEFGIVSSRKEYAKWDYGVYNKFLR